MDFKAKRFYPCLSINSLYTAFITEYDMSFYFPGESHDIWELDYIVAGAAGITSGVKVYECHEGDIVIHPAGLFHSSWAMNNEKVKILTISFNGDGVDDIVPAGKFTLTPFELKLTALLGEKITEYYYQNKHSEPPYLSELPPQSEKDQIVKGLLESLLLSISMKKDETHTEPHHGSSYRFIEIAAYLTDHVCENIDVENICISCGIGRSALKELFRKYTGIGVMKYFNYLRIRYAIKLIGRDCTMAEIARDMNFSSQNYFSAFFKRETGLTPTQYKAEKLTGKSIYEY